MARGRWKQGGKGHNGATGGHIPPTDARLGEVARILALGILRLRARQEAANGPEVQDPESDFGLDFSPDRSVHAGG